MFKNKFTKRRFWVALITVLLPQMLLLVNQTKMQYLINCLVAGVIIAILILITWNDKNDRFWITRYLGPNINPRLK